LTFNQYSKWIEYQNLRSLLSLNAVKKENREGNRVLGKKVKGGRFVIKKALISVSDKTDLEKLIKELVKYDVKIIASEGTAKMIRDLGYPHLIDVTEYTEYIEITTRDQIIKLALNEFETVQGQVNHILDGWSGPSRYTNNPKYNFSRYINANLEIYSSV